VTGPDVHLENFQLTRSSDVYSVFLDNYGTDGLRLGPDGHQMDGRTSSRWQYVEGLELSPPVGEVVFDTKVTNSTFTNVNWGIFQANPIPGTTKGFVVDHSTFKHNYADDLEFNGAVGDDDRESRSPTTHSATTSTARPKVLREWAWAWRTRST